VPGRGEVPNTNGVPRASHIRKVLALMA